MRCLRNRDPLKCFLNLGFHKQLNGAHLFLVNLSRICLKIGETPKWLPFGFPLNQPQQGTLKKRQPPDPSLCDAPAWGPGPRLDPASPRPPGVGLAHASAKATAAGEWFAFVGPVKFGWAKFRGLPFFGEPPCGWF